MLNEEVKEVNRYADINERIKALINSSKILLFMKGNPQQPMCGFSANVCAMLAQMGVEFKSFDILSDEGIRQGVKEYSNWPTYPQLYVNGELIGGNDIITEMYHSGELETLFKK
ncbi:MAG: Grx4 family monothiol glutaredoxin [Epsilonproteobacteria bacterium]|nr:MAG: Grx4 family monothiol glutaredoxin [Campylobacterota bacterium]RLA64871.1 MAG: Grx4 family monothiol glutaredoxin [Campylobacterota bacterium]